MWNYLRSYVIWLHEPEHVARFQQYFGIVPKIDRPPDVIPTLNETNLNKNNNNNNTDNTFSNDDNVQRNSNGKNSYDSNVLDECMNEIKHNAHQNKHGTTQNTYTKEHPSELDYKITSWFWYYFFQFGAALGNEIFYILFFPTWIWNVDGAVARKISILWAFFMYIGQATKDILAIPRPASPPVLKLEKRYVEEYGFPSTHAMFAAGIPLSLVLLSIQRYDFNLWVGLSCAAIVCVWVCLSRIYLGMHTFLDIITGTLYALLLVYIMFPYVDAIDNFQLNYSFSPILNFCIGIILIKCYPSLKQWSTARSDTTVILGSAFGLCSATTAMHQIGLLQRPLTPPIYAIIAPNLGLCIVRTIIGMLFVYATRQIVKTLVLRITCAIYGLDWKNPETKRLAKVEMPYYYLTYYAIGFTISFICPLFFRAIGINRDYSYTEL
ncbi:unnamed protein product [Adineta steineri]|uniref:Phosphatidic acid phosphatase type 2/haloperoxidase domain-containing protein n=1 Tax=Adineta steineri TaxID=433720 RepID=A0A813XW69_9BILA|nr:unnamed protein product [Adineta steineri]